MKKLPSEIKPSIIPLKSHNLLDDVKVKCPVCNDLMLPFTFEPEDKENPVIATASFLRMCPTCRSQFIFSDEATEIIWRKANQ